MQYIKDNNEVFFGSDQLSVALFGLDLYAVFQQSSIAVIQSEPIIHTSSCYNQRCFVSKNYSFFGIRLWSILLSRCVTVWRTEEAGPGAAHENLISDRARRETGAATLRRGPQHWDGGQISVQCETGPQAFRTVETEKYFAIHWTVFVIFISSVEKVYSCNVKKMYKSKKICKTIILLKREKNWEKWAFSCQSWNKPIWSEISEQR